MNIFGKKGGGDDAKGLGKVVRKSTRCAKRNTRNKKGGYQSSSSRKLTGKKRD